MKLVASCPAKIVNVIRFKFAIEMKLFLFSLYHEAIVSYSIVDVIFVDGINQRIFIYNFCTNASNPESG